MPKHLEAANAANKTKRSGSHLDQGTRNPPARPAIPQEGGETPANVPAGRHQAPADHTQPVRSHVAGPRTAERQGGTVRGHDRTDPTAGKAKAGNKLDQHPSLKRR